MSFFEPRNGDGSVIDERTRASIPMRSIWMPVLTLCCTVLVAGVIQREQLSALRETVVEQGKTIKEQGATIGRLSERVAEMGAELRGYRGRQEDAHR